jgi:hypothetical protein
MDEPSMADTPRKVTITTEGPKATVVVHDHDLSSDLAGYTLEHRAGQPPVLVLYPRRSLAAAFEGLAHVVVADEPDPGPAVLQFLRGIDPAALENAALNRDDLGSERYALTRAMLAQLADWAEGKN